MSLLCSLLKHSGDTWREEDFVHQSVPPPAGRPSFQDFGLNMNKHCDHQTGPIPSPIMTPPASVMDHHPPPKQTDLIQTQGALQQLGSSTFSPGAQTGKETKSMCPSPPPGAQAWGCLARWGDTQDCGVHGSFTWHWSTKTCLPGLCLRNSGWGMHRPSWAAGLVGSPPDPEQQLSPPAGKAPFL